MGRMALTLLLLLAIISSQGQTSKFEWVKTIKGDHQDSVTAIDIKNDTKGNVFSIGVFTGKANFDGPNGQFYLDYSFDKDQKKRGFYVTKVNPAGKLLWAHTFGGDGNQIISSISLDLFGNSYIIGNFIGNGDFDPGAGTFNLKTEGIAMFILKLDSSGNFKWAKKIDGKAGSNVNGGYKSIEISGNLLIIGSYSGIIDFDPGSDSFNIGTKGYFLLKLSPNGNLIWAKQTPLGGTIASDGFGNIFIAGLFGSTVDFDPGPKVYNLSSNAWKENINGRDVCVLKLNASGNFLWAKQFGGKNTNALDKTSIEVDKIGNVWITGNFERERDFDPGPGTFYLSGVAPGGNMFEGSRYLTKLDSAGKFVWAKLVGGTFSPEAYSLDIDIEGNSYLTGGFTKTVDFDPGVGIANLTANKNSTFNLGDVFVLKLDKSGNFVWVLQIGGTDDDGSIAISVDLLGNIFTLGYFADTFSYIPKNRDFVDFDPGKGVFKLNSFGVFIHKMSQESCSYMAIAVDTFQNINCKTGAGYISAFGVNGTPPYTYHWSTNPRKFVSKIKFDSAGIYSLVLSDAKGCFRVSSYKIDGPKYYSGFDLNVNLISGVIRPGRVSTLKINENNDGCDPTNGQLKILVSKLVKIKNVYPTPSLISGDTLIWYFSNFNSDSKQIKPIIDFVPETNTNTGDSVLVVCIITPQLGDKNPSNNIKNYKLPIVNSFDPNIKSVYPVGSCNEKFVLKNKPLTYTIQFQNTGAAEAIDIFILDTLDKFLNIKSLHLVGQSHPNLITEIIDNKVIKFRYDNIYLPDSASNEPASHGYVVFEISPDSTSLNNSKVYGKSGIYFDFNSPVYTNLVKNTLTNQLNSCVLELDKFQRNLTGISIFPNPNSGKFNIEILESDVVKIFDMHGMLIYSEHLLKGNNVIDLSRFSQGVYILETANQKYRVIISQ
jgi:uncharacterized repeat protein (TIGR01451 family)